VIGPPKARLEDSVQEGDLPRSADENARRKAKIEEVPREVRAPPTSPPVEVYLDDIIDPRDTRPALIDAAGIAADQARQESHEEARQHSALMERRSEGSDAGRVLMFKKSSDRESWPRIALRVIRACQELGIKTVAGL